MIKYLRAFLCLFLLTLCAYFTASAQNCTVNANGNHTICPSDPITLQGSYSGTTAVLPVWTQVSGPAVTVSNTTASGGAATATVTGYAPGGVYTFRLSSKCGDGTPIQDDAVYTVNKVTQANAGSPSTVTMCPGTFTLSANAAGAGEVGTWSVVSGGISPPSANNSTITLGTNDGTVGTNVLRWTISTTGTPVCQTSSTITIINLGGATPPVGNMSDIHVTCYTVTGSTTLNATFGGDPNQPLQRGTWSVVTGPSTPTFGNIHANNSSLSNLVAGTYVLRWTVAGQCQSYTRDVNVIVDAPSQSVTGVGGGSMSYCDARTQTALSGTVPLYAGETVQWTKTAGPAGATIVSPTSSATEVTGLDGHSSYTFHYVITNPFGCSSAGDYNIGYTNPPSITLGISSPQVLACSTTSLSIPYSTTGGSSTQWELVSAPSSATIITDPATGGFNNFNTATASPQVITGLSKIGTYVIRFVRTSGNATGGCADAFADLQIIVSEPPYTANAGTSQVLACNVTSTNLAGNLPLSTENGTGSWSQISGPSAATITNASLNTTPISNLIPGVYTFRWSVSGGELSCGDTHADVKVTVSSGTTAAAAGSAISACFGSIVTLAANQPASGETGTWSFVSATPSAAAPTFTNSHDPNSTVSGFVANTTYVLKWSISGICGTTSSNVTINTNSTNGPKQATAGPDQCIASPATTFTLAGNAPSGTEVGTWTLLAGAPNTPTFTASSFNTSVTGAVNGTYKFEWKLDNNSCTTTRDTVVITIAPTITTAAITGGTNQQICGITSVSITGNTPATNETGTWTQVSGAGGVIITSPHSATTTLTGIKAGRYQFAWTITNGACTSSTVTGTFTYDAAPTTAAAGTNQTLCDQTTATLAANTPAVGTGLWSVVSGPSNITFTDPTNPTTGISGLTLGVYTLKWTISSGAFCTPSTSQMTITVNQSAKAGSPQTLCNQSVTLLSGNEGSTGTWTFVSGPATPTITYNNDNTAIATGMTTPGVYTYQYAIGSFSCGAATATTTVTVNAPPSTANAGADKTLCTSSGSSVTLAATTPTNGTGAWTIISQPSGSSATVTTTSSPTSTVTGLIAGTYILQWRVTSTGCTGTTSSNDIMRIDVYDPPTPSNAGAAQPTACTTLINLSGNAPTVGLGTWTQQSGPTTATIDQPNNPTTHISGISAASVTPYVFVWTITNGVCTASASTVSITVTDVTPTVAQINSTTNTAQSVCTTAGTASIASLAGNTATVGTGTWTVISKTATATPTFGNIHTATTGVSGLTAGTYILGWTIANNATACTTVATDTVKVYDPPSTSNPGTNTSVCYLAPVTLNATAPTTGTGVWTVTTNPHPSDPAPVFSSTTAINPTVTGLGIGIYGFTWTVSNGPCTTSANTVQINITDCQIAISKEAPSTPVPDGSGGFNVTYKFHVQNTGGVAVSNIQVTDDMSTTFPSPKVYTISSITSDNGAVVVDNTYTGASAHTTLLNAGSSTLAASATATITVVVNVKLHN